ncbi:methionyl-tRNA formyltransferase [Lederbergia wuyishanensis]|uniref:Methionyl-tRNA formyltransferase n=1 Tax=Lederbergia wuyishanensis TaxID=1347903 RepID=A0ABU0CZL6_9BACI|nr:methionyl-tRNA formyltransferase [Lederbergia wuyishanensis]MCJ8006216.1 methionyl-tRNA formyltransferase [Lederbergia wuyishanensis]MDQ0341586.1 methionyl-tRNA formyltransferase [Lederbergia wuyishanensis]
MTKIVFMGTPDFSVPVLRTLIENGYDTLAVVTQPDRPVGRKKVLTPPPVKVEAERHGIRVLQPEKIRDEESANEILNLEPDLIVTAAYGQILPTTILEAPKYGCINVHASLLPELRGGAPIHYAIIQGKEKTGITIMYMVDKLDAGDIISQVEVPIHEDDNVGTLHDKLSIAGSKLLIDTIPKLISSEIKAHPQDHEKATFASNIKREQEKINWHDAGEKIYNQIRGLCPWPVAYTTFNGQVWKVWKAEKIKVAKEYQPGKIILVEQDGFVVSTGNNIGIKIQELQPAGKKKMSANQFLNGAGNEINIGSRLDSNNE